MRRTLPAGEADGGNVKMSMTGSMDERIVLCGGARVNYCPPSGEQDAK